MKVPYRRIQTVELSYRVGNITKKQAKEDLREMGMEESEIKRHVGSWFR